jgi:predicted ABC-type sugar transport system permease subunit
LKLKSTSSTIHHHSPGSLLVPAADGVLILLDGGVDVRLGEVLDRVELLGGHVALEVGLEEESAADRRAVPAAVAGVVLDVVDGLRVGGGHDGPVAVVAHGGRALEAVLERVRESAAVLGRGAGACDLPRLLEEPAKPLEQRLAGAGGG